MCPCCNALQPSRFHREEAIQIIAEYKQSDIKDVVGGWTTSQKRFQFTAEKVRTIFQRITDNDVEALVYLKMVKTRMDDMFNISGTTTYNVRPSVRLIPINVRKMI